MTRIQKHERVGDRELKVFILGDSYAELQGGNPARDAINYAQSNGFPAGGVDPINSAPYPVDADGVALTNPMQQKAAGYCREIRVKKAI